MIYLMYVSMTLCTIWLFYELFNAVRYYSSKEPLSHSVISPRESNDISNPVTSTIRQEAEIVQKNQEQLWSFQSAGLNAMRQWISTRQVSKPSNRYYSLLEQSPEEFIFANAPTEHFREYVSEEKVSYYRNEPKLKINVSLKIEIQDPSYIPYHYPLSMPPGKNLEGSNPEQSRRRSERLNQKTA